MQTIDLQKIIDAKGILIKDLGKALFPKTKYPYLAIRRVMQGKAFLSSAQVVKLSDFTQIPVNFLFNFGKWELSLSKKTMKALSGEITAELNTETWETQLFKNGEKHLDPFKFAHGVAISTYLEHVTNLILKNK